jgi:hypothetical protein
VLGRRLIRKTLRGDPAPYTETALLEAGAASTRRIADGTAVDPGGLSLIAAVRTGRAVRGPWCDRPPRDSP